MNWGGINFLLRKDGWKKYEKNNLVIALNVLKDIYPVYFSKHNSNLEKHIILLMNPNREWFHYLAIKKLPALLGGITSKHQKYQKAGKSTIYYLSKS